MPSFPGANSINAPNSLMLTTFPVNTCQIHGLTRPIVEGAIARCLEARLFIMDNCMKPAISVKDIQDAQVDAMDVEPLDSNVSDTVRIA